MRQWRRAGDDGGAPDTAPAKPKQPRKIWCSAARGGFVHSSIPLAAKTMEEMGKKTGAWTATITYDPADINDAEPEAVRRRLPRQHHRLLPRRADGQGRDGGAPQGVARLRPQRQRACRHPCRDRLVPRRRCGRSGQPAAGGRRRVGGGRGGAATPSPTMLVARATRTATRSVSRDELSALADAWFDKLDTDKTGQGRAGGLPARGIAALLAPAAPPPAAPAAGRGAPQPVPTVSRHLAGVQQDDRRLLQVPLERSAVNHRQDRRSEEPADRDVQGQAFESTTRPIRSTRSRSRARTSTC